MCTCAWSFSSFKMWKQNQKCIFFECVQRNWKQKYNLIKCFKFSFLCHIYNCFFDFEKRKKERKIYKAPGRGVFFCLFWNRSTKFHSTNLEATKKVLSKEFRCSQQFKHGNTHCCCFGVVVVIIIVFGMQKEGKTMLTKNRKQILCNEHSQI